MNPQFEKDQSISIPQPATERPTQVSAAEYAAPIEAAPNPGEFTSAPPVAAPAFPVPPSAGAQPVAPTAPAPAAISAVPGDDTDDTTVDQEWITKAKAIVERTRNDPYVQSSEISKFKADYLKTRHNKTIKVTDQSQ